MTRKTVRDMEAKKQSAERRAYEALLQIEFLAGIAEYVSIEQARIPVHTNPMIQIQDAEDEPEMTSGYKVTLGGDEWEVGGKSECGESIPEAVQKAVVSVKAYFEERVKRAGQALFEKPSK